MNKRFLFFICIFFSYISGQVEIYEKSYNQAMADSVITEDEQNLLDLLGKSLGISEDDIFLVEKGVKRYQEKPAGFSQEGRWYIIAQNMLLGNGLYGNAIPYILDIKDPKVFSGLHMLAFAGGYYITSSYTKKLNLPLGRAFFQNTGAGLGLISIYPLMAMVGFENWFEFDPDFKIGLTYEMITAPVGIWYADRLYRKWNPSDGQASMITQGTGLGALNAWGLYSILTDIPDRPGENWLRIGLPLTYAGGLTGGYLIHKYVEDKSYSRGDAFFVSTGALIGALTYLELLVLLELDTYRSNMFAILASVNGFSWWADHLVGSVNLTMGDARIIALGSVASYMAWVGTALLLDVDYASDFSRLMDITALVGGWYFTFTKTANKTNYKVTREPDSRFSTAIRPTLIRSGNKWAPGFQFQVHF